MMLQTIRERSSGVILWVIVIAITLSFALWGVSSYFQAGGNTTVIEVNGEEVTLQTVTNRIQQRRSQVERDMPIGSRGLDAEQSAQVQAEVIDDIVNEELERQWALRSGVVASDYRLAQYIRYEVSAFQNEDGFDASIYRSYIRNQGYSEAYFENVIVRPALSIEEMRQAVLMTGLEPLKLTKAAWERENQEREYSYARIKVDHFYPEITIDEQAIVAHYEANAESYFSPEQVRLEYLELDAESLLDTASDQLVVLPEDVAARYEVQLDSYKIDETRRVRHILLNLDQNASTSDLDEVEAKINAIRDEIAQGTLSFEDAAKKHSDDTASGREGGDLGFFGRGMMVEPFEKVAFEMAAGELSQPVKTQFGFHLLRVEEIRPATVKSLEEVAAVIERDLKLEKAQLLLVDKADLLANLVWENPASLEQAAKVLKIDVQQTDYLTRDDTVSVLKYPAVLDAAFSADLTDSRQNSDVIQVGNNQHIVIRVSDYQPAAQKTLDQVRSEIVEELKLVEAKRRASHTADALIAALDSGETLEGWASTHQEVASPITVTTSRTDRIVPTEIIGGAFSLSLNDDMADKTSVQMPNGDRVVIRLQDIITKSADELSATELSEYQQMVSFSRGAEELNAVKKALRELAKIEVKEDRI